MSSVRQILACLCLVTSASMPCWAETAKVSPVSDCCVATVAPRGFNLANSKITSPLNAALQQTAGTATHRKMSRKKKTWIIVGSVLGAIVIGAAIGHSSGGSGSGGGGY